MKIFFIFLCLFNLISCDYNGENDVTTQNYKISKYFNSKDRFSIIYLVRNNLMIDSVKLLSDWYGIDSFVRVDSCHWDCHYKMRGGTGITIWNYARIALIEEKLVVQIHLMHKLSEMGKLVEMQSLRIDSNGYYIDLVSNQDSSLYRLKYDSALNIFYNELFSLSPNTYKGIKTKHSEYIYTSKNVWKEYNPSNGYLSEL
jgi:hypothetical protein